MNATVLISDQTFAPKSGPAVGGARRAFPAGPPLWQDRNASAAPARVLQGLGPRRMPSAIDAEPQDFAVLIEAIGARQDRVAFTRVFAYYAPRVKAYLLRLGLGEAQAEEVSQEVMVAVWRKAASFDSAQASAATWIFRIARNRRIDADRDTQVRRAMAELPAEQRDLVRRAFYEDLSHSEIAASTGVPLGTVKSRLRLAFAKLKLKLAETGDGADIEEARA
jgi:RNA polymerase sigma-70 factor (ECF subfamily)